MDLRKELPFSLEEFQARVERLRERLREREVAGMLVHTPENIFYLSGYQTPGYYAYQTLLVPEDRTKAPIIILRRVEESNVMALSWIDTMRAYTDTEDPIETTANVIEEIGLGNKILGIEKTSWFLTLKHFDRLRRLLPNAKFADCSGLIEQGRLIKSAAEITYIRKGARVAEAALQAGLDATAAGRTENDIAAEIYRSAILAGGEYPSLPQFVASGYRSGLAHATWGGRRVEPGDVVYYEVCGTVQRYSAVLYRCATIGQPKDRFKRMSDATLNGLDRVLGTMKPGVTCGEVANAWAEEIVKAGFPRPTRRAGYSIGISFPPDWGEGHILSLTYGERAVLEAGMVFHVPSCIRETGVAILGNSETILVTEHACEALTSFPRQHFVR